MQGTQFWQLYTALIHAFPTEADLAAMVRGGLAADLAAITAATNMQEQVFDLIHWAEAQGTVAELVAAAQKAQPTNPDLQALAIPPQAAAAPLNRSPVRLAPPSVGQWVLVIVVVLGCELVVTANLVAVALDRFSAGDTVLAWIYLGVGLLILLTTIIAIVTTIRAQVRKRSQRP